MMKRIFFILTLIGALMLAGCGETDRQETNAGSGTAPVESTHTTTTPTNMTPTETATNESTIWSQDDAQEDSEDSSQVPDPWEQPTTLGVYATVIGEYYAALSEGYDAAQMMELGLNYMTADRFFAEPLEDIGYVVTDLDEDGMEELVIGSLKDDEFYGKLIFSLYTLDEKGVPQLLFDSTERNRYYYAGSFCFANLGSSGWNSSFVTTLKLEGHEMIDMTYTTDPADYVQMELTPLAQWTE